MNEQEYIIYVIISFATWLATIQRIYKAIDISRKKSLLTSGSIIIRKEELNKIRYVEKDDFVGYMMRFKTLLKEIDNRELLTTYFIGYQIVYLALFILLSAAVAIIILILREETQYYYVFAVALIAWLIGNHSCSIIYKTLNKIT